VQPASVLSTAGDSFWTWSLAVYGEPAVAPICLGLQDRYGADVNLVLFALWLARCRRELDLPSVGRVRSISAGWQGRATAPLRTVRRMIKRELAAEHDSERQRLMSELHRATATAELAAERVEQHDLACLLDSCPERSTKPSLLAAINLGRVLPAAAMADAQLRELIDAVLADPAPEASAHGQRLRRS
jgi:uncharacterized protein (TIGR02444 family)